MCKGVIIISIMIPYKFMLLSLFAGIVCKLYDDLNDNDLYTMLNMSNKSYINKTLKALHYISFSILSLNYALFYLLFMLVLCINAYFDKDAFSNPYECSGLMSGFLLVFFVNYSQLNVNYYDILFCIILLIGAIIVDFAPTVKVEYSINKLYQRAFGVLFFIVVLLFNYQRNLLSESIILSIVYILGYLVTSCIFQYILLSNNKVENEVKE